jgi:hypothetical protein
MFAFFINGELKGFWANKVGDKFYVLTCSSMGWDQANTNLVYYPGLKDSELELAQPSLSSCTVNKKETVEVQVTSTNELGEEVITIELQENVILDRIIQADNFVTNGIMVIPC